MATVTLATPYKPTNGKYDSYLYADYYFSVSGRSWELYGSMWFYTGSYSMGSWGNFGSTYLGPNSANHGLDYTNSYSYDEIVPNGWLASGSYDVWGTAPSVQVNWSWGANSSWGGYQKPSGTCTMTGSSIGTLQIWNNINVIHPNGQENTGVGTFSLYTSGNNTTQHGLDNEKGTTQPYGSYMDVYNIAPKYNYYTFDYVSGHDSVPSSGKYRKTFDTADEALLIYFKYSTFTISYNANGGSGAPGSHSYVYAPSGSTNLSSTKPTRSGYTFLGWSLSSTATSASYSAGQAWALSNNSNYTLYAVWQLNPPSAASITSIGYVTRSKIQVHVSGSGVGISNYTLYYRANSTGSYSSVSLGTSTSGAIVGLSPNTNYQIYVRVTNAAGHKDSSAQVVKTKAHAPSSASISSAGVTPFTVNINVSGTGDTNAGITNYTVYYRTKPKKPVHDMALKYMSDGSTWARVFRHNIKEGTVLFSSVNEARNTQTTDKYSRLYLLDDNTYKGSDNKFEFMLSFPSEFSGYNRWKQTDSPCNLYTTGGQGSKVPGYSAIHIDYGDSGWGGLERNASSTSSIDPCYLDGSIGFGNWWFAIAPSTSYDYGGLPGPSSLVTADEEIWVRIDDAPVYSKNLGTSTATILSGLSEETEYVAWVAATNAYGTNYSPVTTFTTLADQAKIRIKGAALPDKYQRVEYIQTNGAQLINLGKVGDTVATYDIAFISDSHRQLMGYGGSGSEYWGATNSTKYESGGTQGEATDTTKRRTITWTYSYRDDISKVEYDGVSIANPNGASKNVDEIEYKLFNISDTASADYGCACKLYGLQMWHYGNLVRNLIPCYRKSDNVIGLFDTVSMTFYTNIGTGSFGKGANIETGTGWLKGKTYYKKNGAWVKAKKIYIKVNGQWKIGTNYDD